MLNNNEDFNNKYKEFQTRINKEFDVEESKKMLEEEIKEEVR